MPVVSSPGLTPAGIEENHCHHSKDHSPYVFPYGFEEIEKTPAFFSSAFAGVRTTVNKMKANKSVIHEFRANSTEVVRNNYLIKAPKCKCVLTIKFY